jgi:hypothetical protein
VPKMITMFQWGLHPIIIREIYSYRRSLPFLFILRQAYSPNGNSHLDQNASIDADFLQEVPFGVSIFAKEFLGVIFASKNEKLF